jgi:alpha-1,2-glucosyltransferase
LLYIWPFIIFFSWPILLVPVLNLLVPNTYLPTLLNYGFPKKQKGLPRLYTILMILPIMLAAVHFNTIVHPFTLADNRHYVFYAFRILLGYHPAVKYAAVLIYFLCGWAVISAFGFSSIIPPPKLMQVPPSMAGSAKQPSESAQNEEPPKPRRNRRSAAPKKASQASESPPVSRETFAKLQEHIAQRQKHQKQAPRVSFVIVWLAATALSLVTAPLVEPRYFIIPWVMWRLHLPPQPTPAVYRQQRPSDSKEALRADWATYFPLFLETAWFLAVNAVTGYVFLYKGFEWPQEPGAIQRFMW